MRVRPGAGNVCTDDSPEVSNVKVFTSVFVLDGLQTTFDDIELSLSADRSDPEFIGKTDGMRRLIAELQAPVDRTSASDGPERARA